MLKLLAVMFPCLVIIIIAAMLTPGEKDKAAKRDGTKRATVGDETWETTAQGTKRATIGNAKLP